MVNFQEEGGEGKDIEVGYTWVNGRALDNPGACIGGGLLVLVLLLLLFIIYVNVFFCII
jgi:hypothetical protein